MKKNYSFLIVVSFLLCTTIISCRPSAAKKAAEIVKKYSGKFFNAAKKEQFGLRYSDEVLSKIHFEEVECEDCDGIGYDYYGDECETCGGTGIVYEVSLN